MIQYNTLHSNMTASKNTLTRQLITLIKNSHSENKKSRKIITKHLRLKLLRHAMCNSLGCNKKFCYVGRLAVKPSHHMK